MAHTTSAARPKRAGEEFTRAQDNKKPRFDYRNPSTLAPDAADEEDDLILNADVIGKSGAQTKRNAVNIDGYESDSDNDNFDARAADREKRNRGENPGAAVAGSRDEDEDDMFADLEEGMKDGDGENGEEIRTEGKKVKKDVRFLDPSHIEGQVNSSTSGGHVSGALLLDGRGKAAQRRDSVSSSSSSGEDEDRAQPPEEIEAELAAELGAGSKKRHAPRLDAFNLRDEEEEGRFDAAGNFVRKAADPDADSDRWLEGLSKKDVKRARHAQAQRDLNARRKAAAADALLTSELLAALIARLQTGETALEALQRLHRGKSARPRRKRPREAMQIDDEGGEEAEQEAQRRAAVEGITAAADALYSRADRDIYDTEREVLMRRFARETGEAWRSEDGGGGGAVGGEDVRTEGQQAQWEYRWSDARDGGERHGPFDGSTMTAWQEAGYFGEGVEFRRVGKGEGADGWSHVLDVE